MKVEWLPAALADRDAIVAYLEGRNITAAIDLLQSLILAGESLPFFPHRGRPGQAPGTRELVAVRPYLLVYDVDEAADTVRILRVWHGAQERRS